MTVPRMVVKCRNVKGIDRSHFRMLFLFCHVRHYQSYLAPHRRHSEICLDCIILNWFSSCLRGPNKFLRDIFFFSVETPLVCGVPKGSVFRPLFSSLYTKQLVELIQKFCIDYHFFCRWFWALLVPTDGTWVCAESDRSCSHEIGK